MQYEFLKQFPRRMKNVGMSAVLIQSIVQKTTWKQYGFIKADEQINLVFAVMLYIMEQSLKEENATMDDIGAYIDNINMQHLKKNLTYDDCRKLGDYIVNVILSNEGKVMYFDGFDFEQNAYHIMHISYVANKIVYLDQEIKRTSYYLTDDGYNLLLSTLEIENNMKLTIHEMIFQMHLEKQSYDKAVDEIKNVFNLMRIQLQKIQEAMGKIRRNALNYSVRDYEDILLSNLDTISDTKEKFQNYRQMVKSRAKELEEENINVRRLSEKDEKKLGHLRQIERYLNRTIDEHQKILSSHFDLKALYTKELEELAQMSLIKRFPLRTELYDKILEKPQALENLDYFLRPLFNQEIEKSYNLNKALELQKPVRKKEENDTEEELDFDEEAWQKEQERIRDEKLKRYEGSLLYLVRHADENGEISLEEIAVKASQSQEERETLVPNVEIFKEIMVELIKNREIDLKILKKERSESIQEKPMEFQLNEMMLQLADTYPEYGKPADELAMQEELSIHEMEARFVAITANLSQELKSLEEQEQKAGKRYQAAQNELMHLMRKYGLEENAWVETRYNREKELYQESALAEQRKKLEQKKILWNEQDKKIAVLCNKIDTCARQMLEECGQETPLPREEVQNKDFDAVKNQLSYREKGIQKRADELNVHLQSYDDNLTSLAEYEEFPVKEKVGWEEDFAAMDAKQLRTFKGILVRDYKHILEECRNAKEHLAESLNRVIRMEEFREDYYRKPLESMLELTDDASQVLQQLNTTI